MTRLVKIILCLFLLLTLIGCNSEEDSSNDYVVIDVRTTEEFEEEHIEGAINISVDVIEYRIRNEVPNKDTKIYLYCRSGNRSSMAAEFLIEMGYTDVVDLGSYSSAKDFFSE